MNIRSLNTRLERMENTHGNDEDNCENFWLVRGREGDEAPERGEKAFHHTSPLLDVPHRLMKRWELKALLAAINGTSRSVKQLPADWSKVPEYMRPEAV